MQTLTLRCALKPTPEQAAHRATVLLAEGRSRALRVAREYQEPRRFRLHHLFYNHLHSMGLSANLALQATWGMLAQAKGVQGEAWESTMMPQPGSSALARRAAKS